MQRSSRKSGCLFNFTLLPSLLLILLGVGVTTLWVYVLTHFPESCDLSLIKTALLKPEFWLNHWIVNLFPGLSLLILGYGIPKRLSARRQPGFCGLGWLVMVLSAIYAVLWNIAFVIVGCLGFFPAQS